MEYLRHLTDEQLQERLQDTSDTSLLAVKEELTRRALLSSMGLVDGLAGIDELGNPIDPPSIWRGID